MNITKIESNSNPISPLSSTNEIEQFNILKNGIKNDIECCIPATVKTVIPNYIESYTFVVVQPDSYYTNTGIKITPQPLCVRSLFGAVTVGAKGYVIGCDYQSEISKTEKNPIGESGTHKYTYGFFICDIPNSDPAPTTTYNYCNFYTHSIEGANIKMQYFQVGSFMWLANPSSLMSVIDTNYESSQLEYLYDKFLEIRNKAIETGNVQYDKYYATLECVLSYTASDSGALSDIYCNIPTCEYRLLPLQDALGNQYNISNIGKRNMVVSGPVYAQIGPANTGDYSRIREYSASIIVYVLDMSEFNGYSNSIKILSDLRGLMPREIYYIGDPRVYSKLQ